jgi:hypothetical protein
MTETTMKPQRVQRKRTKGYRLPPNTVSVTRPGRWGNPFHTNRDGSRADAARNVMNYRLWLAGKEHEGFEAYRFGPNDRFTPPTIDEIRRELRGKNLACYCEPGKPCHADVLLELANEPQEKP